MAQVFSSLDYMELSALRQRQRVGGSLTDRLLLLECGGQQRKSASFSSSLAKESLADVSDDRAKFGVGGGGGIARYLAMPEK